MVTSNFLKIVIAGTAVLSLAGCLGNGNNRGGGGGGGGGSTPAEFDAKHDGVYKLGPSTKPITGKADYKGKVEILTNANSDNEKEAVYGDLEMAVDFATGVKRPISGTMGNFAGQYDGEDLKLEGTLSTEKAKDALPNFVETNTVDMPVIGAVTSTHIGATFTGSLVDPDSKLSGDAEMTIMGDMYGDGGKGFAGMVGGFIKPKDDAMFIAGGRAYAEKQ